MTESKHLSDDIPVKKKKICVKMEITAITF